MLSALEEAIRQCIHREGPIPFARFMEMALYHPLGGYYCGGRGAGTGGDYFTSPQAHPAFGALLAVQAYQVWEALGRPSPFLVVEQGAGEGLLARDLLTFATHLDTDFYSALRYLTTDISRPPGTDLAIQAGAQRLLASCLPLRGVVGCLIANELLDSFPVHRWRIQRGSLQEAYVALEGERLAEVWGPPSTPALGEWVQALGVPLVEGLEGEACLAMPSWAREVYTALERGMAIVIDYGGASEDLYLPGRGGTVRAFRQHLATGSIYRYVGQQDITASVDFTSLQRCAREAGLEVLGLTSQGTFLRNLGWDAFRRALLRLRLPPGEGEANRFGLQALVQQEGLGGFGVCLLGKGLPPLEPWGVCGLTPLGQALLQRALREWVPCLTSAHMPLLAGRYPDQAVTWQGFGSSDPSLASSWAEPYHGA